jgi:hypothetical protein
MADVLGSAPASEKKTKVSRLRSPNYPGINLETAIQRARALYENEKRNAANVSVVMGHWGFNKPTGQSAVSLAAVKSFGLVEDSGSGKDRKLKVSELALKIILDQRQPSPDRDNAIKEAALRPSIHGKLWQRWRAQLPSDPNLRHVLIFEYRFNENAVDDFIAEYKDTIGFAQLQDCDSVTASESDINGSEGQQEQETQTMPETQLHRPQPVTPAVNQITPKPLTGVMVNAWTLSPSASAELRINGSVSAEDLELLRDYVEITIKALTRKADAFGTVGRPEST